MTETAPSWKAHAWILAAMIGLVTYIVAVKVVTPLRDDVSGEFVAGGLLPPVLIGVVGAGLVATLAGGHWRYVGPLVLTPGIAAVVIAVTQGPEIWNGRSEANPEPDTSSTITAPSSVMGWRPAGASAEVQRIEGLMEEFESQNPGVETVVANYRRGDRSLGLVGFNAASDSDFGEELVRSPGQALTGYLAGAGVADSEEVDLDIAGVESQCSEIQPGTVTCGWADQTSLGLASWTYTGVSISDAADLTERLIAEVRVVAPE